MPKFARGGQGAEEAAKALSPNFAKTRFFSLDPESQMIVRFLTEVDEWAYVQQHTGVPTKNPPPGYQGNWPESMPAVCRHDEAFKGQFFDCYICDSGITDKWNKPCRPSIRVWMLACVREPVMEDGKVAGYKDAIVDVPVIRDGKVVEGETVKERNIIVVNMGMKNFFSGLKGIYGVYGSTTDRDFVVKRTGSGKESTYHIMPLDKIAGCEPGTEWWEKYEKSIKSQNLDLDTMIDERASDEYYARFFDPSKQAPQRAGDNGGGNGQAPAAAATPSADVDPDRVAAMRERVRQQTAGTAAPPTAAPAVASSGAGPKDFG